MKRLSDTRIEPENLNTLTTRSIHYATKPMMSKKIGKFYSYLIVNQGTVYTADINIKTTQTLFLAFYSDLSIIVNLKL